MLKEITLGQYYPGKSILHRLDPRVKLMGTLVFIICLFAFGSTSAYLVAGVTLAIVIVLSTVPFSHILRSIRMILILMLVTAVFNLLLTPGDPIVKFGIFRITDQGVKMAIHMTFRLSFLVMGSSIMTLTTTPNQLTGGLEQGLGWMKRIHVPVHEIALMMSIALRFIPTLIEETDKIMSAQKARGADFETGSLTEKAKALMPLLVLLFVSAFRRADELAVAMESRCYHGDSGRTRMKQLTMHAADWVTLALFVLLVAATVVVKRLGM
jgi:energy-coupling factor transport system permease protein